LILKLIRVTLTPETTGGGLLSPIVRSVFAPSSLL
jgi:hypothetical protein